MSKFIAVLFALLISSPSLAAMKMNANGTATFTSTVTGPTGPTGVTGNTGPTIVPINAVGPTGYTVALTDAAGAIYNNSTGKTGCTFTIPANGTVPFPIGSTITFINGFSGGTGYIAITTDQLVLAANGATGTRVMGVPCLATAIKAQATVWLISGSGIT